ncbi:hypothetical protein CALVIDRAFT_563162 [Calocera viscosa TUFC12733]|uniref:Mug135-like C-terminal domain-containing protein n=1 Tax=Calocera viscosa (strain TUFC12733) TaxID=1330018 RepID=A0A167N5Z6_CALVF|nr:hypothetical protein CALVIDRAFT_563162 [Calocera viscosa TUFC12733]
MQQQLMQQQQQWQKEQQQWQQQQEERHLEIIALIKQVPEQLKNMLGVRFDRLERSLNKVGMIECKSWNAQQHDGPFEPVMTPDLQHLTDLNPPLPPVTSVTAVKDMSRQELEAIYQACHPGFPIPPSSATIRKHILRAVGCTPSAYYLIRDEH